MSTHRLQITGMTCDHCARALEKALNALPGVKASVSYEEAMAYVETARKIDIKRLLKAVQAAGFSASLIENNDPTARDGHASWVEKNLTPLPGIKSGSSYDETAMTSGRRPTSQLLQRVPVQSYRVGLGEDEARPTSRGGGEGLHVAILGSGAAAFACAIRATEAGARVTLIEEGILGGTCVNVGCVPSKILIRAAQVAHLILAHPFQGLERRAPSLDRAALLAQQQGRVEELRQAKYQSILETHPNLELIKGRAHFKDARTLGITAKDGSVRILRPDRILIATGATPATPPIPGLADTPYWTSTEALAAREVPKHLIVLGGSAVGLELGQAFLRLGARVTLIELYTLLPREDPDVGLGLKEMLQEEGMRVLTHTETKSITYTGSRWSFGSKRFRIDVGSRRFRIDIGTETVEGDRLLVATGRQPNTHGLQLDRAGVRTDNRGAIVVDDHLRTSTPHIYAAGDCTTQPQLVYVAAAAGTRAAINMLGGEAVLDLSIIPTVVFTDPQVATVGLTEAQAKAQGIEAESRILSLDNVPRALANFALRGFIKLVAERETGRLLGAQVLAPEGGEIIQTAALALRHRMTIEALAGELFPYLTMVEGLKLCAQTFTKDVKQLSCCAG